MITIMATGTANSYCSQSSPAVMMKAGAPSRLLVLHWVAMVLIPMAHQLRSLPPR